MKTDKQHFPVVLFVTLYKVVLTFESVDKNSLTIQMKATAVMSYLLVHLVD